MRPLYLAAVMAALVAAGCLWSQSAAASEACSTTETTYISVLTAEHRLYLCEGASSVRSFDVRLAHDGAGKTKEGDGRIPLGAYPLGAPRPSKRYGTFIPIGYPTPAQKAQGYTGGSVGVHGPDRRVRWLGRFVNTFDTTDGCVGLARDEEMQIISSWVRRKHANKIVLVAP